jgi:hypothetical protein
MSLIAWIGLFAISSLFWKWTLSWGGAEWMEGWKSSFFVGGPAYWSVEQIKFYVLLCWIANGIWFVVGLFLPTLRFYSS